MKVVSTLVVIMLCFSLYCNAQLKSSFAGTEVDASNSNAFYERAKRLASISDSDSLFESFQLFRQLYFFDSISYSTNRLVQYLQQIEDANLKYYKSNIIGEWIFRWNRRAWDNSVIDENVNKRIIFTNREMFLFENDSLIRRSAYLITNKFVSPFTKPICFQIFFADNTERWVFNLRTNGNDYYSDLKFDEQHAGLSIYERPNCDHCPHSFYIRKSTSLSSN